MLLPTKVIRALEALAENGTACIDGSDRALFRTTARAARVENIGAHEGQLPPRPEEEIADDFRAAEDASAAPEGARYSIISEGLVYYLTELPTDDGSSFFPFTARGWDTESGRPGTLHFTEDEIQTLRPL